MLAAAAAAQTAAAAAAAAQAVQSAAAVTAGHCHINGFSPLSSAATKISEKRKIIEEIALSDVKKVRRLFTFLQSRSSYSFKKQISKCVCAALHSFDSSASLNF